MVPTKQDCQKARESLIKVRRYVADGTSRPPIEDILREVDLVDKLLATVEGRLPDGSVHEAAKRGFDELYDHGKGG